MSRNKYIQPCIRGEYVKKWINALEKIGFESPDDFGCIDNEREFDKVMDSIKDAIKDRVGDRLKLKRGWETLKKQVMLLYD